MRLVDLVILRTQQRPREKAGHCKRKTPTILMVWWWWWWWWLSPRVRRFWENVQQFVPRLRFCLFVVFLKWRLAIGRAHIFHFLGQNQSTVAQQAEMILSICTHREWRKPDAHLDSFHHSHPGFSVLSAWHHQETENSPTVQGMCTVQQPETNRKLTVYIKQAKNWTILCSK